MIQHILVVGGGSSGWMAATYLSEKLKDIKISLVESSDIPVIGVGESTIPPITDFIKNLGMKESDWMPACNATYKSAIRFENFSQKGDTPFWYPFEALKMAHDRPLNRYWYHKHLTNPDFADRFTFFDYCFSVPTICEHQKTSASIQNSQYAYHFDAGLFGEYLKNMAKANGVIHIVDTITDVNISENGNIISISCKNGDELEADLFLDCTGFSALLIDKQLKEPFVNYNEYLFNDKAIAMRIPYIDKEKEMHSYTNCTAQSAGWIWTIPLYNRIGTGYVYCSRYKTIDEVENEFRRFWGEDRVKDESTLHINMRVGKQRRTWVKNCVAIGLSAGFIEPLESTGLHITQTGIQLLTMMLERDRGYNNATVEIYNDSMTKLFESIRDFLVCHYALTNREDTDYWKDVRYCTKISGLLKERLEMARIVMPDTQYYHQFNYGGLANITFGLGWMCVLLGMNYLPYQDEGWNPHNVEPVIKQHLADVDSQYQKTKVELRNLIRTLPSHYEALKQTVYSKSGE